MTDENDTADPGRPYDSDAVRRARVALDAPPERIGRYRILERLGTGGMGDVFVAEQTDPIKRRVAVKVIKAGMDTRSVVARFEAERQALAMMDHPNIAKVFDAGTTDAGRPYFVMELVRGVPITTFCDANKLTTRQRVVLMVPVCQAVQHAHQKGIIHRDIKPHNVLVTLHDGKPVPKVIDFGIAKATGPALTDKTVYTEFRQMIGTPAYMSPEQAEMSGLDIDTRSDIYSLGVLAYELLTGRPPFEADRLAKAALVEMHRIIREEEPPRPSLRLSTLGGPALTTIAGHRSTEPARLSKLVAGELDWIVMRAMEKDRRRRYDTASDLAADLTRHLTGEPVVAAPPGWAYRTRKLARKHRRLVASTATLVGMLMIALFGIGLGLVQSNRAEKKLTIQHDHAVRTLKDAVVHLAAGRYTEIAGVQMVFLNSKGEPDHQTPFSSRDVSDIVDVDVFKADKGKRITPTDDETLAMLEVVVHEASDFNTEGLQNLEISWVELTHQLKEINVKLTEANRELDQLRLTAATREATRNSSPAK